MTITPLHCDGYDKYGPIGMLNATLNNLLQQSEYNTVVGSANTIVAGLSATGKAISFFATSITGGVASKTLTANYAQVAGTFRFNSSLGSTAGVTFRDGVTSQCTLNIDQSTGTISLRTGVFSGTAIQVSGSSVSANSTHTLSYNITIGAAGAYSVWLDNVLVLSGTGNTRGGTANNYTNAFGHGVLQTSGNGTCIFDDFGLIDASVAFDTDFLLQSTRIETQFPTSDSQKQWTNVSNVIGDTYSATTGTNAPGANQLFLRRFVAEIACTVNSVSCIPMATNALAKFKAVLYTDTAGAPVTLLSSGTEIVGTTSGTTLTGALVTPQAITAGTVYWVGFIGDLSVVLAEVDAGTTGVKAANTYGSGAPATAPAMTVGQLNWEIRGNCTGSAVNWPSVNDNPVPGDLSGISSSTVNNEDLYGFPALSTTPQKIFFGAVKANVKRSDTGARTIDLRMLSGASNSAGSLAGQTPPNSYGWLGSFFTVDPATGVAWTPSGWNGAFAGPKVAS